jgi:hypothetical protein
MARRLLAVSAIVLGALAFAAAPALACGGLVAPGHAEVLRKAITLAAWHDGYEHYVTGFQFIGGADHFGYIVPLPGVPSKIQKGGGWTLERLEREINPIQALAVRDANAPVSFGVQVVQQVTIGALDISIVRGGGRDVARWAERNGFALTADTPDVMAAYSSRGAVFALARFDNAAAAKKGLVAGSGQVIHFTIPIKAPWIPLRILALGKTGNELVNADLFVLTDHAPQFGPALTDMPGTQVRAAGWASAQLLADLRSDKGMGWLPAKHMWFTAMTMNTPAKNIHGDLSIDGGGPPLALAAVAGRPVTPAWAWWIVGLLAAGTLVIWMVWRPARPRLRSA